ncbi:MULTISPECIES: hypothetical protein [unclassified Streptomyces]|uniref:hypothetical protein n=1 Tax=unclassified Streptomyces TaxID=2593676 RepID=UPI00210BF6A2|nr:MULTISPECIES: hypothetical protein [unclassified Streptomyces]
MARKGGHEHYQATAADHEAYRRARRPKAAKHAQLPLRLAVVEEKLALSGSPDAGEGAWSQ